ncbi:aromatic acid exporter family protein [Spongisporangium articulatum]|uniref:Aromatic acid exporter family protein n=1 Tax=Spongisporangium articulatum TaxID=3362603 RepID=A0ABW8AHE0_9ACTN
MRESVPVKPAVERYVQEHLRAGLGRVRDARWSVMQCALAAMLAWSLASDVIGHAQAFYAPVAAVVCLGVSNGQRIRRVLELAVGVTVGVGIADLLYSQVGSGTWQIGLVVAVALLAAQFLGGGPLATNQAAVQASFLIALPAAAGHGLGRWEDALIGGVCALLVAAVLPPDPIPPVRRHARALITELAEVVEAAAAAIRTGDPALADATLDRARRTQADVERWTDALRGADEITTLSPLRRRHRAELRRYRLALVGLDRATRNMRVAVRRVAADLDQGHPLPEPLAGVLHDLGRVLHALHDEVGRDPSLGRTSDELVGLAARLDPARLEATSFSATVVLGQVRSAVVDLLGAVGFGLADARAKLAG